MAENTRPERPIRTSVTEREEQISLLKSKEWFFPDVSYDQIEVVLKQREGNAFLVTNGAFDDQFLLYTRVKTDSKKRRSPYTLKQDSILQKRTRNSFLYYIEGKNERTYDSVVEAIEAHVTSLDVCIAPAVEQSIGAVESSISTHDNLAPPEYTTAANYPGAVHPLPSVKAKVNIKKGEDADSQQAPFDHVQDRSSWVTHLHYYRELHWCHPKNTCHCCFHRGYDEFDMERELYDCRGTGPCCCFCLTLMYCLLCLFCCPCLFVVLGICCAVACADES
jgi:hypothetical protein